MGAGITAIGATRIFGGSHDPARERKAGAGDMRCRNIRQW